MRDGTAQEPFKFGQKSLQNCEDSLMESPMKRRRLAMPGAPVLLENLGTPPGPVVRKKKSSWTSSSSPRKRSTPGKGSGHRRKKTGPPPSSKSSPVPPTTPWMGSRWPGSKGTLGGTSPMPTSYTRGSWPVHGIVLPAYTFTEKSLQAEPGGAPAPNC